MGTRSFDEQDEEEYVIYNAYYIAKRLIEQIQYYIKKEELNDEDKKLLINSKEKIILTLQKYGILEKFDFNVMARRDEIRKDFYTIFDIEDEIHDKITIPTWKKYISELNKDFKQGDDFLYLVHAGTGIINLPGKLGYTKNRNFDGDYTSASLITNNQMSLFQNNKVGLILEPNEGIICSGAVDAGTMIYNRQSMRSVFKFNNGKYIHSGYRSYMMSENNYIGAITKIQHPCQLDEETTKVNENHPLMLSGYIDEVVMDDAQVKVVGILFETSGCEINLADYMRVKQLEYLYKVPIRVINRAVYRKKAGLSLYTEDDWEKYLLDIENFENEDNWKFVRKHPEFTRSLMRGYFNDVVINGEYEPDVREKIDGIFVKLLDYSYFSERIAEEEWKTKKIEDTEIESTEILRHETYMDGFIEIWLKKFSDGYKINIKIGRLIEEYPATQENYELVYKELKAQFKKFADKKEDEKMMSDFLK